MNNHNNQHYTHYRHKPSELPKDIKFFTPEIAGNFFLLAEIFMIFVIFGIISSIMLSDIKDLNYEFEFHKGKFVVLFFVGTIASILGHFAIKILHEFVIVFFEQLNVLRQIRDELRRCN